MNERKFSFLVSFFASAFFSFSLPPNNSYFRFLSPPVFLLPPPLVFSYSHNFPFSFSSLLYSTFPHFLFILLSFTLSLVLASLSPGTLSTSSSAFPSFSSFSSFLSLMTGELFFSGRALQRKVCRHCFQSSKLTSSVQRQWHETETSLFLIA